MNPTHTLPSSLFSETSICHSVSFPITDPCQQTLNDNGTDRSRLTRARTYVGIFLYDKLNIYFTAYYDYINQLASEACCYYWPGFLLLYTICNMSDDPCTSVVKPFAFHMNIVMSKERPKCGVKADIDFLPSDSL